MGFDWSPSVIVRDDTLIYAGSDSSGSESYINELQAHTKDTEAAIPWYNLSDSGFSWQSDPIASSGDLIDDSKFQNIRDAVDLLEDNRICSVHFQSDFSSQNSSYNSGDDGTVYSSEDSIYNSGDYGTVNSSEDSIYNSGDYGTVYDVYESGDNDPHTIVDNTSHYGTHDGVDFGVDHVEHDDTYNGTHNDTDNTSHYGTHDGVDFGVDHVEDDDTHNGTYNDTDFSSENSAVNDFNEVGYF